MIRVVVALVAVATTAGFRPPPAAAQEPDTRALAATLRGMLVQHLPDPLVRTSHDWGKQADVVVGWKMHRSGPLRWDAEPRVAPKNDGNWHRLTVTVPDPKTITLDLAGVRSPADGALVFTAHTAADVDLKFEQQLWKNGVRLVSTETRGRCRAAVKLTCEATTRLERPPGSLVPTAVVRVRVTAAELSYDKLVVEHALGVGGSAAKAIGDAGHALMTRFKPSLERDLLARADAAIVKAGDTKEVRLGLGKLRPGK